MDWSKIITENSVLLGITFLFQLILTTRLTNSVKHEYDKKIELLKCDLRKNEEFLKYELKVKENEINSLRNNILSGIIKRQEIYFEKSICSADKIWNAIIEMYPGKIVCQHLQNLKLDYISKECVINPDARNLIDKMMPFIKPDLLAKGEAKEIRPYVNDIIWAYYSAYKAIISQALIKVTSLKCGLDKDFSDIKKITELVNIALPHQKEFINQHGAFGFYFLLDELEDLIIIEIRKMLRGDIMDKESIDKASMILKETNKLQGVTDEDSSPNHSFKPTVTRA